MNDAFEFDVIVVGGGSSGAVVAARLSQNPDLNILLIEAGPDFPLDEQLPAVVRSASAPVLRGYNWDFAAKVRERDSISDFLKSASAFASSPKDAWSAAKAVARAPQSVSTTLQTFPYVPGKIMGGSSSVNAALALRPLPDDFEAWSAMAGPRWTWEQVRPYFLRLERDLDCHTGEHGQSGPMPISRPRLDEMAPEQLAFHQACIDRGLPMIADFNTEPGCGVGPLPSNALDGVRVSTALAYLASARGRQNLTIRANTMVGKITTENCRATGVEAVRDGQAVTYRGRKTVICAGAINTPAILLRSGIGPAQRCQAIGVKVVADLAGVGQNLMDHPSVMLWMVPHHAHAGVVRRQPQHQVMARIASDEGVDPDLNLFFLGGFATSEIPLLQQMLRVPYANALSVSLTRPLSRGRVDVQSTDPLRAPTIELNLGSHQQDIDRMMRGVRVAWDIAKQGPIADLTKSIFMWGDATIRSDNLLRSAIDRLIGGTWHAAGTARMGARSDPMAVVDAKCHVHGVDNLSIADASVMPSLPGSPTNLTCIMLGERVAEWMAEETCLA